jgi:hypothetical protein
MKWIPFVRRPTTKVIIAAGICYSRNGHVSKNSPLIFCKATELDRRVHKGLKWEVHGITNLQLILSRTIHSWVDSLHKHQCLVCAAYGSKFTSILLGRLKFEVIMSSPHYHQLYGDTLWMEASKGKHPLVSEFFVEILQFWKPGLHVHIIIAILESNEPRTCTRPKFKKTKAFESNTA